MIPDIQALLFNPAYSALGVPANINGVDVTVIDHTTGIAVADRMNVETIRPVCYVRTSELSANSLAVADLLEGELIVNGETWRIKSTRLRPSPTGEYLGEVMLILLMEGYDGSA